MELLVVSGPDRKRAFSLGEGQSLLIGRGKSSDVQLRDPRVSRKHCFVKREKENVTVTDCESAYGTMINGRTIKIDALRPGDVLKVGHTEIRLQSIKNVSEEETVPPKDRKQSHPTATANANLSGLIGQTIGRYQIEKEIAKGTRGVIFLARHIQSDKPFALKVIWPTLCEDIELLQRIDRAVKAMQPIDHPNIVRIVDSGRTGDYCWIAMEYVKGKSVAELIPRIGINGMLEWQMAYRVAVHVARALEAVSGHRVVHRQITPQNILIQSRDKLAKLGDLILAKAVDGGSTVEITIRGQIVGELAYMSPEATYGTCELDIRSDIYSLGATVYSLLTGKPPFECETQKDLMIKIRKEDPIRPNRRGLSSNIQFETIVMKMLARRPDDRYQNPTELLKDLHRIAEYQGIVL